MKAKISIKVFEKIEFTVYYKHDENSEQCYCYGYKSIEEAEKLIKNTYKNNPDMVGSEYLIYLENKNRKELVETISLN